MSRRDSRDEYDRLCRMISRWNDRRVELFEISMPNEHLEFEGVMKFYFQYQDVQGQKVATKCIRVSNTATVQDVIEVLVQKFRPDLRMLPNLASFALYEVHDDDAERRMDLHEKPLWTMLKWSTKDIDGRFLLRNELKMQFSLHSKLVQGKKSPQVKKKKSPKIDRKKNRYMTRTPTDITDSSDHDSEKGRIARSLYMDYPSSRVTLSITNPDIVKFHTSSGGNRKPKIPIQEEMSDSTIPISTEALHPLDMPSTSILATKCDTAVQLVKSAIENTGVNYDPEEYCLVQVTIPSVEGNMPGDTVVHERILDDNEIPVKIHNSYISSAHHTGQDYYVEFHIRRRDSFQKQSKFPPVIDSSVFSGSSVPVLIEVPDTPIEIRSHSPCHYPLSSSESTEIGSHSSLLNPKGYICLTCRGIYPRHCVITRSPFNTYSVSLLDQTALVKVNEIVVKDTESLAPDSILLLGDKQKFRFVVPKSSHVRSFSALHSDQSHHDLHDGLSKAFSFDNLGHSKYAEDQNLDIVHVNRRTVSEHTLKGEGLANGATDSARKDDDGMANETATTASITTTRNAKKRHNSAPHSGEPILDEMPENELAVLPASITFQQSNENRLLQVLIAAVDGYPLQFKLAPAYAIYMIARHHLSSEFVPEPTRHHSLVIMFKTTCSSIKKVVKESKSIPGVLAFWLSNTSELLHFLRRDYRLYMFAHEYENTLTCIIHMAYKYFFEYMISEINTALSAFLSPSSEVDMDEAGYHPEEPADGETSQEPDVVPISHNTSANLTSIYWSRGGSKATRKVRFTVGGVISTLSATVSLLRLCKVNNTLSIPIFNLLFHNISMRLFNKLITEPQCCSKTMGQRLLQRLERLTAWADKESLKLPADEHLALIFQAARLLIVSNDTHKDIGRLHALFPQLNSRQVKALFHNIESTNNGETALSGIADKLISMAYNNVDQQLLADGHEVHLQEDPNLEQPFLIPEHGYSCDTMRGVPVGVEEYLDNAISSGLCQLVVTKESLGCWIPPRITTSNQRESPISTQASSQMSQTLPKNFPYNPYAGFAEQKNHRPKSSMDVPTGGSLYSLDDVNVITVNLKKSANNKSLGISICESRDPRGDSRSIGIFIKSLSKDGPAYLDGRLHPGDQILQIDNTSLRGYNRDLVSKLLRSSHSQVTITVATNVAQLFQLHDVLQSSPRLPSKLPHNQTEVIPPPPKEGSSHAMKAARREMRRQQQVPIRQGYEQYPTHVPVAVTSPAPQMTTRVSKWLQEQREISQQKTSGYHREQNVAISMPSLIPERDEHALPASTIPSDLITDSSVGHYHLGTPSGSDISDVQRNVRGPYSKYNVLSSASKLVDPQLSSDADISSFNDTNNYSYHPNDTLDSSLASNSQLPYKDLSSLSGQPSDIDTSQSYPSLAREKLSMEVGYHTQLSSTGLSVSSVLDQLSRKGKKGDHGLQISELQGLEVDEIQLEKQRMQLLFYNQEKEKRDQETSSDLPVQQNAPNNSSGKRQSKEQFEVKTSEKEEDELLMDPDKFLQVTKLRQDLDSVRKLISDQRKRCRELQFAKEREEQMLAQAETRFKSQSRHFMPFMRPEDAVKWQRDQKRKLKEWERFSSQKKEELHQIEVKEMEAKARQQALEQHASELKKQLNACEGKLAHDSLEQDWIDKTNRPLRVMSTDSITTGSSWLSNENIAKDTISLGSESNAPDYQASGARSSPLGSYSDSSSPGQFSKRRQPTRPPELHGSTELPTLMRNPDLAHNVRTPLTRGTNEQDERLRMLKEEHMCSLENISSRSSKEKAMQLLQLKKEARRFRETPDSQLESHPPSLKQSTNIHSSLMRPLVDVSGGYDSRESSLSSSTPDVVPLILASPSPHQSIRDLQSHSVNQQPESRPATASACISSSYSKTHQQPFLRSRSRDELSEQSDLQFDRGLPGGGHRYQLPDQEFASHHVNRKAPKTGGPHSYRAGRPEPASSEDKGKFYRERIATPQSALTGSRYVQRQQTEL